MNTTVEDIQKHIKNTYKLNFSLNYIGTQRELEYQKNKIKYRLSCGYAQSNINDPYTEYWSIYEEMMDKNNWHGSGSARVDEGFKTVDEIMQEWGFKKEGQTSIFDFIGD